MALTGKFIPLGINKSHLGYASLYHKKDISLRWWFLEADNANMLGSEKTHPTRRFGFHRGQQSE